MSTSLDPCASRCDSYAPGHLMHWIHAKLIGRTPWGWRDAVVQSVGECSLEVRYLLADSVVRLWHHESLAELVLVGEPVRVHEGLHALGGPFGWLNVVA